MVRGQVVSKDHNLLYVVLLNEGGSFWRILRTVGHSFLADRQPQKELPWERSVGDIFDGCHSDMVGFD